MPAGLVSTPSLACSPISRKLRDGSCDEPEDNSSVSGVAAASEEDGRSPEAASDGASPEAGNSSMLVCAHTELAAARRNRSTHAYAIIRNFAQSSQRRNLTGPLLISENIVRLRSAIWNASGSIFTEN